jgi:hypothetical protein
VSNATFNNISIISLQSVLLVEETGVPGESFTGLGSVGNVFFSYLAILASCFKIVLDKLELHLPSLASG